MSEDDQRADVARMVFAGLTPTPASGVTQLDGERARVTKGFKATVPIVLVGAMAVTFNLAGPAEQAEAAPKKPSKAKSELTRSFREAITHLFLFLLLEHAQDTINRLPRVDRMQCAHH